jgi:hypothetical protein
MAKVKEIWKDVIGYEGLYRVSNHGNIIARKKRIWNAHRGIYLTLKEKLMRPTVCWNGRNYYFKTVKFRKNGEYRLFVVSRLIATMFCKNKFNKPEVNHKDANPLNNYYKNLEWCTRQENINHSVKNNLVWRGSRLSSAKLKESQIPKIRELANHKSQHKIAKIYGVSQSVIMKILQNKTWTHC